jgi:hypothetical protein
LIHALIIGTILFVFGHYQCGSYPKWSYYLAFLIKSIATIGIGYYFLGMLENGDTIQYFRSASTFVSTYGKDPGTYIQALVHTPIPEHSTNWHSVFFVKIISPVVFLSGHNYWLTSLYLTLINFLLTWSALSILNRLWERKWTLYFSFFMLPTVAMWSGGVFKEALANGCFVLGIALIFRLLSGGSKANWFHWLILLGLTWILTSLRFYLGGVLIGFACTLFWFSLDRLTSRIKWMGFVSLMMVLFFSAQLLHPWLRPSRLPLTLFENYTAILAAPVSNSSFQLPTFGPTYAGLILTAPLAWFTGFYRPFLWEVNSFHWFPVALEKLSFLVFSLLTLGQWHSIKKQEKVILGIIFLSLLNVALTLATPNFGSLLRYQSAFLPFFFILIAWIPLRKSELTR